MITLSDVHKYKTGTAEYVVRHGQWRKSRGKNPSETFLFQRDPRKALRMAERLAYFPVNGTYLKNIPIPDYKCADCGAMDCKLWRQYQTFDPKLLCAVCAAKDQNKSIDDIDNDGMRSSDSPRLRGVRTDQIGWYVPAVPTEDDSGYWGYTSVPQLACDWWEKLPTLPQNKEK